MKIFNPDLDQIAQEYVRLCFSIEEHSPGYVDAYFGPPDLKNEGLRARRTIPQIKQDASSLISRLEKIEQEKPSPRVQNLITHLRSLHAKADLIEGAQMTFDQESLALYGARAPSFSFEEFQATLSEIEALLPGDEPLNYRIENLRNHFLVPKEKLNSLIEAAIKEARTRTSRWISLPEKETFAVELVQNKPWSGYNWFEGNARSLIQINTDLPIHLDLIITLACHEGYPGHHVFNCLREEELYRKLGWVEFSVFPLFGPDALIAEGTANFAVQMIFPSLEERYLFESQVLCPLAGLNAEKLKLYDSVLELVKRLSYVQVEVARRYLDGKATREEAMEWLMRYRLLSQEEAEHSLKFIEFYRSYVINYKLGEDLVKAYMEGKGGTPDRPHQRWQIFSELLQKIGTVPIFYYSIDRP